MCFVRVTGFHVCTSDLLSRFKLWTIVTEIINLSNIPAIQMLNQQSTSIKTNCAHCFELLQNNAWACAKCHLFVPNLCAVW